MAIDLSTLERTAELSRLHLSENEKIEYAAKLSDIVSHVEKIKELDTSNVKVTDHIMGMVNVSRADVSEPSFATETLSAMAPFFEQGHFIVPRIIDGD